MAANDNGELKSPSIAEAIADDRCPDCKGSTYRPLDDPYVCFRQLRTCRVARLGRQWARTGLPRRNRYIQAIPFMPLL